MKIKMISLQRTAHVSTLVLGLYIMVFSTEAFGKKINISIENGCNEPHDYNITGTDTYLVTWNGYVTTSKCLITFRCSDPDAQCRFSICATAKYYDVEDRDFRLQFFKSLKSYDFASSPNIHCCAPENQPLTLKIVTSQRKSESLVKIAILTERKDCQQNDAVIGILLSVVVALVFVVSYVVRTKARSKAIEQLHRNHELANKAMEMKPPSYAECVPSEKQQPPCVVSMAEDNLLPSYDDVVTTDNT